MTRRTTHAGRLLLGLWAVAVASAYAQQDQALIDALVRKGILSEKDAQSIEAEVQQQAVQAAPAPESKLKLGDWVQELKVSGDLRLRNQWDQASPQLPPTPRRPWPPGPRCRPARWRSA
ncbi:MAG TPA: hypothetical protein VGD78_23280 [Chthoniobacterales bacterium]